MAQNLTAPAVKEIALACGFDLAGIAAAGPAEDYGRYEAWARSGAAGEMRYLTDHRGPLRQNPANLLPEVKSMLCVGKLYNSAASLFHEVFRLRTRLDFAIRLGRGLSRRAAGRPVAGGERAGTESRRRLHTSHLRRHSTNPRAIVCASVRAWLDRQEHLPDQSTERIVVLPGRVCFLAWIYSPICLLRTGAALAGAASMRVPRSAIVQSSNRDWTIDSRLCISYFTIEKRGEIPAEHHSGIGNNIFGCDICQDVCPWNRRAPQTEVAAFQPREFAPPLERLAGMTEDEFRSVFRGTPVWRAKYAGFLRNVAIAMGNSGEPKFLPALRKLAEDSRPDVSQAARFAIGKLWNGEGAYPGPPTMRA